MLNEELLEFSRIDPDLPLFRATQMAMDVLYTPGSIAIVAKGDSVPQTMQYRARDNCSRWQAQRESSFEPTGLTVCLSNHCTLGCKYCYSAFDGKRHPAMIASDANPLPLLKADAIVVAARQVAHNCKSKGLPMTYVVHGGGEPTLHQQLLRESLQRVQEIAAIENVELFTYIATSGRVTAACARWLAHNFDQIGLSVDGPADLQNQQRPTSAGERTANSVETTARILRQHGARVSARATVLPQSLHRMAATVEYIVATLGIRDIQFEPAYGIETSWQVEDAPQFVDAYRAAEAVASQYDAKISCAGVRLDELHGPHCNTAKQVLQLSPDGSIVNCFLTTDGRLSQFKPHVVGGCNPVAQSPHIDETVTQRCTKAAFRIPSACQQCVNVLHCARECPERCVARGEDMRGGFRCATQLLLSRHWLTDLARQIDRRFSQSC